MIEFKCLHCNQVIRAQPQSAGMSSKCPRCKANIRVPMPQEELEIPPSPPVESPRPKATPPPVSEKVTPPIMERQPLNRNAASESSGKNASDVVKNRFPVLQILSNIYLVTSVLIAVGTLIICFGFIYAGYSSKDNPAASAVSFFAAISYFFSGIFATIVLLSISELIKVFLAIERNTRKK